jgi:hypothetical protein
MTLKVTAVLGSVGRNTTATGPDPGCPFGGMVTHAGHGTLRGRVDLADGQPKGGRGQPGGPAVPILDVGRREPNRVLTATVRSWAPLRS